MRWQRTRSDLPQPGINDIQTEEFSEAVLGSQSGVLCKNDRESDEGVPRIPDRRIPAKLRKRFPRRFCRADADPLVARAQQS